MVILSSKSISDILIENYSEIVKRLRWRVGGLIDPDDIVQETFLKLQTMQPGKEIRNQKSYVFRMADNLALDLIRNQGVRMRHFSSDEISDRASEAPSPEQVTDYRERLAILKKAIADLPPRQKEAFLLHKFDGLTHTEISERLGISRSAVEKLIMKSLLKCRAQLGDLLDQQK